MSWLEPNWPAVPGVRGAFSLRDGGVSQGPYASLNLALHVGDATEAVQRNRELLKQQLALPAEPAWLKQVHGRAVVDAATVDQPVPADASFAARPGVVCVVMVADCLPVLLSDRQGRVVAAVHAGWRGLADEVIAAAVGEMRQCVPGCELQAWLGPCIGPGAFEVGPEVRDVFVTADSELEAAFIPGRDDRWQADLQRIACHQLQALAVGEVYAAPDCTHADPHRFFSFRRDGASGRMGALIWREV